MPTTEELILTCKLEIKIQCNLVLCAHLIVLFPRIRCGYNPNNNCYAKSSPGIITGNCQGKGACTLSPKNSVFGDPCGGVVKYIDVQYECSKYSVALTPKYYPNSFAIFIKASFPLKKQVACEHSSPKKVSCPAGQVIEVHRAYYGRTNSRVWVKPSPEIPHSGPK